MVHVAGLVTSYADQLRRLNYSHESCLISLESWCYKPRDPLGYAKMLIGCRDARTPVLTLTLEVLVA